MYCVEDIESSKFNTTKYQPHSRSYLLHSGAVLIANLKPIAEDSDSGEHFYLVA